MHIVDIDVYATNLDNKKYDNNPIHQVIFEESLELADVKVIQELFDCFYESYLHPSNWQNFLLKYTPLYFNSAVDVTDKYITLVRYVVDTSYYYVIYTK